MGSLAASLIVFPARAQQGQEAQGFRVLEARKTGLKLTPAGETAGFGYDGAVPGPVLRYKYGADVAVRLVNRLDQPTSLHWQGLLGDNANDGVAGLTQQPVAPGQSYDYRFKADIPGLYFYKPAIQPHNVEQISRGLCGVLIVEEQSPPDVDRDLVIVIQDWKLDAAGALALPFGEPGAGRVGSLLSANLAATPLVEAAPPGARVRLRIVNGCVARMAVAVFDGGAPHCIAIDGQACDPFQLVRNIAPIAPGARFEFVYDLPAAGGPDLSLGLWAGQDKPRLPVFVLKGKADGMGKTDGMGKADGAASPVKPRPAFAGLPANPRLPPEIRLGDARKLELALEPPKGAGGQWTFNGQPQSYAGKPLFSVRRGTPVSIGFSNRSDAAVSMHVHGHCMRLLHDRDDGWEPYWRNSVIVAKGATKHVAFVAGAPGKWALRSDVADQEAAGLACWFEVT
ncbi:MAG: multicopper oxidase family protein [Rhodoblastus sp.]